MSHQMKYYLAIERNKVPVYETIWADLKHIMLTEIQMQNATYCMFPFL